MVSRIWVSIPIHCSIHFCPNPKADNLQDILEYTNRCSNFGMVMELSCPKGDNFHFLALTNASGRAASLRM